MEFTTLRIERSGAVGRIILDRPERLNALNEAALEELPKAFEELGADEDVRVIILKGAGRAFCTGLDMKERGERRAAGQYPDAAREMLAKRAWHDGLFTMWDCPKPIIGQLHGYAIGWGGVVSLFCDLRYIADDFQVFHVAGVTGAHFAQIWSWWIGITRAKEFEFRRSYRFQSDELLTMGYANRIFPADQLEENVEAIAAEISNTNPLFLQIQKLALNRQFDQRGFREFVYSSDDLDALLHWSVPGQENFGRLAEVGGDRRQIEAMQKSGKYW